MSSFSLVGRLAVITGGGDGIGKAIAIMLASKGCNLALVDINTKTLNATSQSLQSLYPSLNIKGFECDMTDQEQIKALVNKVKSSFNTESIQLLFNNVGISGLTDTVLHAEISSLRKQMDINVWSMIYGTRAFLPMILSNSKDKHCYIVNTGSIASIESAFSMYSITKHAVIAFSETIYEEIKRSYPKNYAHITVSTLVPGFIKTSLSENSAAILGRKKQFDAYSKTDAYKNNKQVRMIRMTQLPVEEVANRVYIALRDKKTVIPTHDDWHEAVVKDRMNALLNCTKDTKDNMRKAVRKSMAAYKEPQSKL